MISLNAKITTAVAVATLVATVLAPASLADTNVNVSSNGDGSHNHVGVNNTNKTKVTQSNDTYVVNNINVSGNTGGNKANHNTGGTVNITSGDINTTVNISNGGSTNAAVLPTGGTSNTTVNVDHNGDGSHNHVYVNNSNKLKVSQTNGTTFINGVAVGGNTGDNKASHNTDSGTITITSGGVTTNVTIDNTGSVNAQQ